VVCGKKMNSGIVFFNKPSGITSFDALRDIKKHFGTEKIGHTGTLDKFAQGLLVVLAGRYLKLSRWFSDCDKKYIGKIHFGEETDTLDPEGNVIAKAALPSCQEVENVISRFTGKIMQEPPVFSAIHVNGKRASELARSGNKVEMKKREVTVYKLELISFEPPFAEIFVHCSSGTYIRSLARDIAIAAGSRAHLCNLIRTQVAGFKLDSDLLYTKYAENNIKFNLHPVNKNIISALGMPWFEVTKEESKHIYHGKPLDQILKENHLCFPVPADQGVSRISFTDQAAVFEDETLIAIAEKKDNKWKYGCVITVL
jgi:tRNA pseudouridine55 synthase